MSVTQETSPLHWGRNPVMIILMYLILLNITIKTNV